MSLMTARATGAAAVAMVVAPGYQFQLEEIQIHLSAAGGAGNLTVTLDGGAVAAVYDTVLMTQDMTAITDLVWVPARPLRFTYTDGVPATSDHLDLVYANANNRTYGITVLYSPI